MVLASAKAKEVEDRELRIPNVALLNLGSGGDHTLLKGLEDILGEETTVSTDLSERLHAMRDDSARVASKQLATVVSCRFSIFGAHVCDEGGV